MITFHPFHVEVSIPVAMALLAFASKDDTRQHLGVGIEQGKLCATDGHVAVMFEDCTVADGARPEEHESRVWARSFVETAVKVAKATKAKAITLQYGHMLRDSKFPPLHQVMPADGVVPCATYIGVDPKYLGQLSLVAKACGQAGVRLVSLRGELDPIGFRVVGGLKRAPVTARAAIMPMRI